MANERRLAGLMAALAVSALSAQKPATDPALAARLQAAVEQTDPFWGIVACGIDGKVVFQHGRGMQDRAAVPIDEHSLFDFAGLADRITAAAALQLMAQKRWQPDDPIARALSDWPKDKAAITWRHLLTHTSGLPPEADWAGRTDARKPAIAAIAACKLVAAPGSGCHWSLLNSNLLALLLDQHGGDFEEYVKKRVFAPAGMTSAAFFGDRQVPAARVTFRLETGKPPQPANVFPWDWGQKGGRGVLLSIVDAGAFAQGLLGSKWIDAPKAAELLRPLPGGDPLRVQSVDRGGVAWTQLHGAIGGYRSRILLQQKARCWIAILAGEQDLDPLEAAVIAALLPALPALAGSPSSAKVPDAPPAAAAAPAGGAPPANAVGKAQIARFLGSYELPDGGRFEIVPEGDGIAVLGLGLVASARLQFGTWPVQDLDAALRAAEDRSLAALQPLVRGGGAPPARLFANDAAAAAAQKVVDKIGSRVGKPLELLFGGTLVGSARKSSLRLGGPKGSAFLEVSWSVTGAIASVAEASAPPPFLVHFTVEREDWAVGKIGSQIVSLSVEGSGAGRTLVYEDRAGLAELSWKGDPR